MNKNLIFILTAFTSLLSASAIAASGEYWEITSKTEMEGMPFAMPATKQKVCIATGQESNQGEQVKDKNCEVLDTKRSGNKTTMKMRCNFKGDVMLSTMEQTSNGDTMHIVTRTTGKMEGQDMNSTTTMTSKRTGVACDAGEMKRKMEQMRKENDEEMRKVCDPSLHSSKDLIYSANDFIGERGRCPGKKDTFCTKVSKDVGKEAEAYTAFVEMDKDRNRIKNHLSVASSCNINVANTTKTICKTLNGKNYNTLSAHCPAEAKTFREVQRRKDCEGRSFTAETRAADMKKCMSGQSDSDESSDSAAQEPAPTPSKANKSSKPATDTSAQEMLESAKKLKGMFSF
jgi:hypothetical protein